MEAILGKHRVGADGVGDFLNRLIAGPGFAKEAQCRIQLLYLVLGSINEQVVAFRQSVSFPAAVQRVRQRHGGHRLFQPGDHGHRVAIGETSPGQNFQGKEFIRVVVIGVQQLNAIVFRGKTQNGGLCRFAAWREGNHIVPARVLPVSLSHGHLPVQVLGAASPTHSVRSARP